MATLWHGTREESAQLLVAISHNCQCETGLMGVRLKTCAPHNMLLTDQRALDGLVLMRRYRDQLVKGEGIEQDGER